MVYSLRTYIGTRSYLIPKELEKVWSIGVDTVQRTIQGTTKLCPSNMTYMILVCVLTSLWTGKYDQIMRWWSSKPQSGIATVLDSVAYCYVLLSLLS